MKLITNRISTGKVKRFEDFVAEFRKKNQIKTASVKTAEQEEADSSGQLKVEPLHQKGESTTLPKNGPSAKNNSDGTSAAATKKSDEEAPSSGQPEAEGTEKLTNDPKVPTKEEKAGSTEEEIKVAEKTCEKCDKPCNECKCEACDCKPCTASRKEEVKVAQEEEKEEEKEEDKKEDKEEEIKEAELTPAQEKLPDALKEKIKAKQGDDGDKDGDKEEDKEEDKKEDKESSQKTQFVKIANLDEKNKGFLRDYWRQLFGDDYVNALISDK